VAGVMGGEETEISADTRDVLIESAYFLPTSVRRTARVLGLSTEASHRFERGADYDGVLRAQERCVQLICEIAGGTATEDALDVYPAPKSPRQVSLRAERVEALTGLQIATAEMLRILTALGFVESAGGSAGESESEEEAATQGTGVALRFVVPTWRVDVSLEEDLVEEIARHVGYDLIAAEIPATSSAGEYQPSEWKRRALRQTLSEFGYDEAISFGFISTEHDDEFDLIPDLVPEGYSGDERFVSLNNPIIEDASRMRPTLLPGLLDALRHNLNHGTRDVCLFETGRVFAAGGLDRLPRERESFALLATGGALEEGRAEAPRQLDFYDLKGALEMAADAMRIGPLRFEAGEAKHLREGQAARVSVDGQEVGTIGRLAESLSASYKFRQPVYVAELDFTALLGAEETASVYRPLPRFPSVVRDISLLAPRRVAFADMLNSVNEQGHKHCRGVKLVDVYEGEGVPEGSRSVTLRVEYRADERTLRDEEVDEMHGAIVRALEDRFGARLRG
ncbi:MAG TPA: phenylalanine--tRNA ligase subunit beta, partial [Pyrinomonadaceae bacterium]